MGLIKTILPPLQVNQVLGADLNTIEGTKVLEAVSQTTYCGLIDTLSLIAVRANEVFSGILDETREIVNRFDNLNSRVNSLIQQAPIVEKYFQETDFEALSHNTRSFYHSKIPQSSRMLTAASRPPAIREVYERCRRPPNLEILDPLNDVPGTSCLKLYSDPEFFEAEWIMEMQKQREAAKVKRAERKKKRTETAIKKEPTTSKVEAKPVLRARYDPHTGQRIDVPDRSPSSNTLNTTTVPIERGSSLTNLQTPTVVAPVVSPRSAQAQQTGSLSLTHAQARSLSTNTNGRTPSPAPAPAVSPRALPPTAFQRATPNAPTPHPTAPAFSTPRAAEPSYAPAPAPVYTPHPPVTVAPPTPARAAPVTASAPAPPPPPAPAPAPPPPPAAPAPPPPPSAGSSSLASALAAKSGALKPIEDNAKAKPVDAQSELLSQIRKGMNLKQTTKEEIESKPATGDNSISAILARRIAIADSDDEDDSESDEWSDS